MKLVRFFFFAALFVATFEKVRWNVAGNVTLADILALLFILTFAAGFVLGGERRAIAHGAATAALFLALFLCTYLAGYFNLESAQAIDQYWKGMIKWAIHFVFVVCVLVFLSRSHRRMYMRAIWWFTAGLVFNSAYGVVQLLAARSGVNLDSLVIKPITGSSSSINVYGIFEQTQAIFRPNALTGDPNHLGIMLVLPIVTLTPYYLSLERSHRLKVRLGLVLAFLLLVEIATLSRSGILGVALGALLLAVPYWRKFVSRAVVVPVAAVLALLGIIVLSDYAYFSKIISSRVQTGDTSSSAHFAVYDFIPQIVHSNPAFGLGLNTFSVYYEEVTGLANWGPHSFYVALIVETGLIGTVVFGAFLAYLFVRTVAARWIGDALAAAGDPAGPRVVALSWGMSAALLGTMLSNVFYLTMSFYYFYVFVALLLALPVVYARDVQERAVARPEPRRRPGGAAAVPARAL